MLGFIVLLCPNLVRLSDIVIVSAVSGICILFVLARFWFGLVFWRNHLLCRLRHTIAGVGGRLFDESLVKFHHFRECLFHVVEIVANCAISVSTQIFKVFWLGMAKNFCKSRTAQSRRTLSTISIFFQGLCGVTLMTPPQPPNLSFFAPYTILEHAVCISAEMHIIHGSTVTYS